MSKKLSLTEAAKNQAAIVVIPKGPLVLAVTRGADVYDLAFPGGKLDPGEQPIEAARREVFEETGLVIGHLNFVTKFENKDGYLVHAFVTDDYDGTVRGSDEGMSLWVEPEDLTGFSCSFRVYNKKLLRKLRMV